MSGPVALHGGGEFQPGDEPFLEALSGSRSTDSRDPRPIRIAVVPTAAARGRPDLAGAHGVEHSRGSRGRRGRRGGVDPGRRWADRGRRRLAGWLAAADVIHFPGGDPDLIPTVMLGAAAWAAITHAHAAGAVLAGASAGAMAFGSWTWTPGGGMAGLKVVHGLVVVPHAREATWAWGTTRDHGDRPSRSHASRSTSRTPSRRRSRRPARHRRRAQCVISGPCR